MKLIESLTWGSLAEDSAAPSFTAANCRLIAYVVRMLCGAVELLSDAQEAGGIVGTFLSSAIEVEATVTTYGNSAQRYEAAIALRREIDQTYGRPVGPMRYARDANTGELLIAVGDLADAARRHVGSSLERGWLDARMEALHWQRITLDGHVRPGRDGRKGPHARIEVYRGHLPATDGEPVTTLRHESVSACVRAEPKPRSRA